MLPPSPPEIVDVSSQSLWCFVQVNGFGLDVAIVSFSMRLVSIVRALGIDFSLSEDLSRFVCANVYMDFSYCEEYASACRLLNTS